MPEDQPSTPPSSSPQGSDQNKPYDLEPAPPSPLPPRGKLSDKGLIDDMPEDADFTHDPEVERALKGEKSAAADKEVTVDETPEPAPPFVRPGDAKVTALVGAGIGIAAIIAAAVNSPQHWFPSAVLVLYFIVLHAMTGVGALAGAAYICDQPLGRIELAAARMLAAVSLFLLLVNLQVGFAHRFIEPLLAVAGYWLTLTVLFRASWVRLFYVAVIHAGLALVVWLGMAIYAWANAPVPKG
jgi:hypothetical protein